MCVCVCSRADGGIQEQIVTDKSVVSRNPQSDCVCVCVCVCVCEREGLGDVTL